MLRVLGGVPAIEMVQPPDGTVAYQIIGVKKADEPARE